MVHDGDKLRPDLTYQPGDTPIIASEIEPNKPIVAVIFNGCIYNHRELRKELEAAGHVFETDHSDTEVLVHGWREWDGAIQDRLDAMYSLLIWDRTTGQAASGRDLVGEKTLYHLNMDRAVSYSSAIAGLVRLSTFAEPEAPVIDTQFHAIETWIRYGWDWISPTSWVYQMKPNQWDMFPRDPRKNFHINRPSNQVATRSSVLPTNKRTGSLNADKLDGLLQSATISRLEADVPMGVFLSGGIDSSLISAITQQHLQKSGAVAQTFSVRMPSNTFDESHHAESVARHIGSEHHTLDCSTDASSDLVKLIEQLGLPFGDSSLLPTYWVSRAAKQHVSVILGGDGADELFGGYQRYTAEAFLNKHWRKLRRFQADRIPSRQPTSMTSKLYRLLQSARSGERYSDLLSIFPKHLLDELLINNQWGTSLNSLETDPMRLDFEDYLPNDLLRKIDTASMSVALEVRSPYLSAELVRACLSTPIHQLMPNGERKGLLKQVARKYLPDHIVDRPKQGFAIPIGEWFRTDYGDMRQLLYDHLESTDPFPGLADADVNINMKFVQQILREHDAAGEKSINPWHGRDHSQRLYMMLVLSIWSKWLDRIRTEPQSIA